MLNKVFLDKLLLNFTLKKLFFYSIPRSLSLCNGNYGNLVVNPNDEYWQVFEACWDSGGACTAVLSTHSPESCLPLTGLTQINPALGKTLSSFLSKLAIEKYFSKLTSSETRNYRKLFVLDASGPTNLLRTA